MAATTKINQPPIAPAVENVPEATVVFGSIQETDDTLFLVDDDGIWTDYQIVNRYEEDRHAYMTGITSPTPFQGATACFFQLAATTVILVCDWMAERSGESPEIPDPTPQDPNMVLLDRQFAPEMVLIEADGNTINWRISGTYVYGFKDQTKVRFVYGRPPWIKNAFDRIVDTPGDFEKDLRGQGKNNQ